MSIINCTANCIHQKDGKCFFDHVDTITYTTNQDCAFFQERNKGKTSQPPDTKEL